MGLGGGVFLVEMFILCFCLYLPGAVGQLLFLIPAVIFQLFLLPLVLQPVKATIATTQPTTQNNSKQLKVVVIRLSGIKHV